MRLPGTSVGFSTHEPDKWQKKQGYYDHCLQREDGLACHEAAKPHTDGLARVERGSGCQGLDLCLSSFERQHRTFEGQTVATCSSD